MTDYFPDQQTAEEDLCRLIAACYYEPDLAFAEENMFDSMLIASKCINVHFIEGVEKIKKSFFEEKIETLLIDYSRLFIGSMNMLASPYESSWLNGIYLKNNNSNKNNEDITDNENQFNFFNSKIIDLYHLAGFETDESLNDLPDHIAIELEFLYVLLFKKNQALENKQENDLLEINKILNNFYQNHLDIWIGDFTKTVENQAQTVFYRELATLTRKFILYIRANHV